MKKNKIFKSLVFLWVERTDLVTQVKDMLEILTHSMVFYCQEDSVENDAERYDHIEDGVIDDCI